MDDHPDSLFRQFKTNIQTISSSSQDIEDLFDNTAEDFKDISERLQNTKLSKKEKIKILFLCDFKLIKKQENLMEIKKQMVEENYAKKQLKGYLEENQHMLATGMYYSNVSVDPDPQSNDNKYDIKYENNQFVVNNKSEGSRKSYIPLETQVIYLLHNVIMD